MRYQPIASNFYKENRKKLVSKLPAGSTVIIYSNDLISVNADATAPFRQHCDLFYLTGIDQEETMVILSPHHPDKKLRELLFVKATNDHIKIWEGPKLSKDDATRLSGIEQVHWTDRYEAILNRVLQESEIVFMTFNYQASHRGHDRNFLALQEIQQQFPLHQFHGLNPFLKELRAVKAEQEINQIRKANEITAVGFMKILHYMKPGVMEYEIEAVLAGEFLKKGSKGFAFEPIVAGGANACILHYINNDHRLKDGDLVLIDFGAEYGNYHADVTRCIPANGRFSARQREVYEAVKRVKDFAATILTPGNDLENYQIQIGQVMEQELLRLGLLSKQEIEQQDQESPAYRKYFMHSTSHHLGLAVHDVPSRYTTFQPGMVLTIEPGIYIPEEGLGVRLEDDYMVTETLPENLTNIPIEIDEIESMMNGM